MQPCEPMLLQLLKQLSETREDNPASFFHEHLCPHVFPLLIGTKEAKVSKDTRQDTGRDASRPAPAGQKVALSHT